MANVMVGLAELDRTVTLAEAIKRRHLPAGAGEHVCTCGADWPCDVAALAECVASLAWTLQAAGER